MSKVCSLGLKRAEEAEDCRLCTALEILEELVADIKSGELKMPNFLYVAMKVSHGKDEATYNYRAAGGDKTELSGLLAIHLNRITQEA